MTYTFYTIDILTKMITFMCRHCQHYVIRNTKFHRSSSVCSIAKRSRQVKILRMTITLTENVTNRIIKVLYASNLDNSKDSPINKGHMLFYLVTSDWTEYFSLQVILHNTFLLVIKKINLNLKAEKFSQVCIMTEWSKWQTWPYHVKKQVDKFVIPHSVLNLKWWCSPQWHVILVGTALPSAEAMHS